MKINFDVAVKENVLCAAAVCRNAGGGLIKIRVSRLQGSDPLKGKDIAASLLDWRSP